MQPPVTRPERLYVIVVGYATHVPSRTNDTDDYFCKALTRHFVARDAHSYAHAMRIRPHIALAFATL